MFIPYSGNSAYCYSNSLHMCLAHAGMERVPPVGLIECMTGMPFGAMFLQLENPLFFPGPASTDPDAGLSRALETLGWTCELWRSDEADAACAKLQEVLREGPALLGPLDMGFLPYDPDHQQNRGGDHFIVALKCEDELVQVHDPQLYPFALLPLADLVRAWYGKDLGYTDSAYTLRFRFQARQHVERHALLEATLAAAQELVRTYPTGPVEYGGPDALIQVAELLRQSPHDAFIGLLTRFALPVGARRCTDAAWFLKEAGKAEAANLFIAKAESFGQAQYYGVQQQWEHIARCFDNLAQIEAKIISCL